MFKKFNKNERHTWRVIGNFFELVLEYNDTVLSEGFPRADPLLIPVLISYCLRTNSELTITVLTDPSIDQELIFH